MNTTGNTVKIRERGNTSNTTGANMKETTSQKTPGIKIPSTASALDPSFVMDGTSHVEISSMENINYSKEIIKSTEADVDLKKLKALRKDKRRFLKTGRRMLIRLCHSDDALRTHDDASVVKFCIKVGIILNEIETAFRKKKDYTTWLRNNNFSDSHLRYFQQARQLARMGEVALKFASLGKNRLLEFERVRKEFSKTSGASKSLDDLLRDHPFLDTTEDNNGELFKRHVDAIITYYRFQEIGIDLITFVQALYAASLEKKALEVKKINQIKKEYDNAKNKVEFLNDYFKNKMASPVPKEGEIDSRKSLNKVLADLVLYCQTSDIKSPSWIRMQKKIVSKEIFTEAYNYMVQMKDNLGITATNKRRGSK